MKKKALIVLAVVWAIVAAFVGYSKSSDLTEDKVYAEQNPRFWVDPGGQFIVTGMADLSAASDSRSFSLESNGMQPVTSETGERPLGTSSQHGNGAYYTVHKTNVSGTWKLEKGNDIEVQLVAKTPVSVRVVMGDYLRFLNTALSIMLAIIWVWFFPMVIIMSIMSSYRLYLWRRKSQ